MRIGTAGMTAEVDKACALEVGIPLIVLMENAALKVLKHLEPEKHTNFVVVCGSGNNGGDGFAIARHLIVMGKQVEVFLVAGSSMSECCKANYNILNNMGTAVRKITGSADLVELRQALIKSEVTVDAIFGTGLNKNVEGIFAEVIAEINYGSRCTVAVDIPSGMQCDSGSVLGSCIKAHKTICFEFYKRGFLNYGAGEYAGEVIVESIGVPQHVLQKHDSHEHITEKSHIQKHLKKRGKYGHKGDFGRTLIIAGSPGFTGAAYIAAQAAVRTGSGLVTLATGREVQAPLSTRLTEAMSTNYEDENSFKRFIQNSDAIAVGPGMGNNEKTLELVRSVVEGADCPVVIDADGINVLSNNLELLKKKRNEIIITPHPGEMARITGKTAACINENRIDIARAFAREHDIVVLLKGYQTVITDGKTTYINPTGGSAMASGGMGDCLTGIIASLLGQGFPALEAACCGAYIHGYAGDRLSEKLHCVNASHIIDYLPYAMKEIEG